ncbi:MAG: hypothetical protein ACK4WH_12020 [Phycisphaerales bacterium]
MLNRSLLTALLITPASSLGADAFNFTVNSSSSAVSYNINASVPFTGTMNGDAQATPPTRLKRGTFTIFPPFVNCGTFTPTTNDTINISGAISIGGSSTNIRPTGAFQLAVNTASNTATLQGLTLNLLGSSAATITASIANMRYESFCAVDPTCALPFLTPITLPLGNATVSAINLVQSPGTAAGTMTPVEGSPNTWNFTIPIVPVTSTIAASFSGTPIDIPPQTLPIAFTGTITISGNSATVTSATDLEITPDPGTPQPPTDLPPLPFTIPDGQPLCAGLNLILGLSISTPTFSSATSANLVADGTRLRCPCDWNNTGSLTVQDIFDFLTSYFSGSADFNGDGMTTVQDIFDFIACYFAPPISC